MAGFADRYRSANCGWVALADETLLIDLPRGMPVAEFLKLVAATTGKPARTLVLTHNQDGDWPILRSLRERGVTRVVTSPAIRTKLLAAPGALDARSRYASWRSHGDRRRHDRGRLPAAGCMWRGRPAGPCIWPVNAFSLPGRWSFTGRGRRWPARTPGSGPTALRQLEKLEPAHVVPGIGTWGGTELLARQRRFLTELRRQVGYQIAQGRPHAGLGDRICLPADCLVWTPYGNPTAEDIEHVYAELTVPSAPFGGREPTRSDSRPHALVLIGDGPHEPGHLEEGLRPVFEATGVVAAFHGRRSMHSRPKTWRRSGFW